LKTPKTRGERLKLARQLAKFKSSAGAAGALGLKTSSYNAHERAEQPGGRDFDPDQAMAYARKFKVDAGWLLTGNGSTPKGMDGHQDHENEDGRRPRGEHIESSAILEQPSRPRRDGDRPQPARGMVFLKGYVGAGAEAHYYNLADDEFEEVPAMEGASDQSVAVEIKGKSFGPLLDGWLVHYEDVRSPVTDDMLGKICVVGLADDRILLKKIRLEQDGTFTLISNSDEPPIKDAIIEWAALVIGFKPRV
jgi:hypothetical protein